MLDLKIDDLKVGSVLEESVYHNNTLLLSKGAVITAALKKTLSKFSINPPTTQEPESQKFKLSTFDKYQYSKVLHLDIDEIVDCAEQLVDDLLSGEFHALLHLVYDYDECTYAHSKNVTLLSLLAGIELQYSVQDLRTLAVGGLLHDIGKLRVPVEIINKPARLTPDEFKIVKKHPQYGYDLVNEVPGLSLAIKQIILQHHENFDGTGYPRCLDDTHGYRLARLVHVCDVYEAMCAKRPYKEPMPRPEVRKFMTEHCGSMFDPILCEKFLSVVPAYLVGEELSINGISCIVVKSDTSNEPMVSYKGNTLRFTEFKNICHAAV